MNRNAKMQKRGPLDAIIMGSEKPQQAVVVFHGYGANAEDLVSLSRLLQVPPGTQWVFANAPLEVSDGGIWGRAWFPLDTAALDEAMRNGTHRDFSNITPEGMKKSRLQAADMCKAIGVPMAQTVFMGFSQGAMLATDLALRADEKPRGLVILSGALLNEALWLEKAKTKAGMPFFMSHGDHDALLDVKSARRLEKVLIDAGLKGRLHEFHGGHEIPQEIIFELSKFLSATFKLYI